MKTLNRKIYISKELNENLKERQSHLEDGIASDPFIPEFKSFNVSYNRNFVKKLTRLMEFLKKTPDSDLVKYLSTSDEIKSLDAMYPELYSYKPKDCYFIVFFVQVKNRIRDDEYYLLYAEAVEDVISMKDIKHDMADSLEWKKEYVLTDIQKKISENTNYNIVLGAAGTGKTDVAIHAYMNACPLDHLKDFSYRDNTFITYSKRLSDYVKKDIDSFWNDSKNSIAKNVYTTAEFFLNVLKDGNIEIPGYTLFKDGYIKDGIKKPVDSDFLLNSLVTVSDFISWVKEGCPSMNKAMVPSLNEIIKKYGYDYPYLFYRGIYKGHIINKASDDDILSFLEDLTKGDVKEVSSIKRLMDNYAENVDELSSDSFHIWYQRAVKLYSSEFKNIPSKIKGEEDFYNVVYSYFDFASPLREDKRFMEYESLFKREAIIIEGYRGEVREEFLNEISILFEACKSFDTYNFESYKYDDNDLCYFIIKNLDKVMEKGNFKNILADEFQDMTEREIHTLIRLLGDEEKGKIHIYGDFEQTINPTFLQLEGIETIYMVNGIEGYDTEILSSSFRYSSAICHELEALREEGKKLFGTEGEKNYVPLISNVDKEFETGGNLLISKKLSETILSKVTSKDFDDIMYITADDESKDVFIKKYKVSPEYVYTVSEAKGREADFVIVYNIVSDRAKEYENLFTSDLSYSRAERIFYNQLYVGITRCKVNFILLEDDERVGVKTKEVLSDLITPLLPENVDLFTEELLSEKTNYYFRAIDSFTSLDFKASEYNLSFYSGVDYDDLRGTLKKIEEYEENKDKSILYSLADTYKSKARYDLARVLYTVCDNTLMMASLDIIEHKMKNISDEFIRKIITENKDILSIKDIEAFEALGYFERKKEYLKGKIKNMREVL